MLLRLMWLSTFLAVCLLAGIFLGLSWLGEPLNMLSALALAFWAIRGAWRDMMAAA